MGVLTSTVKRMVYQQPMANVKRKLFAKNASGDLSFSLVRNRVVACIEGGANDSPQGLRRWYYLERTCRNGSGSA
jgi:hypothetical protein